MVQEVPRERPDSFRGHGFGAVAHRNWILLCRQPIPLQEHFHAKESAWH